MKTNLRRKLLSIILCGIMLAGAVAPITASADSATQNYTLSSAVDVDYDTLPDSDELLAGYLEKQMYGGTSIYGTTAGDRLQGINKRFYDGIKVEVEKIASGERNSTVISFDLNKFSKEEIDSFSLVDLLNSLLTDCPYELYWFDKTLGIAANNSAVPTRLDFKFPVADAYRWADIYTTDTSKTSSVTTAVANAKDIVAEYTHKADLEKLNAYRTEICELVSYNREAASGGVSYGDPWQLIYVFDDNPDTNVVCEGYAKAFQYLCDLSEFTGDVVCNTVTGAMNDGPHMWNIVEYGGKNYLADVTNCDEGTIGADTELFMVGTASTDGGRTYTFTIGSSQVVYVYDEDQSDLICDGYPVLSDSPLSNDETNIYSGTCGDNAKWSLDTETGVLTISGSGDSNQSPWKKYNEFIKTVKIEIGITSICNFAFSDCINLDKITIPDSVTSIGDWAFKGCGKLSSINIPDGVATIGYMTFYGCSSLTDISLPKTLESIDYNAFSCSGLTSVIIPEGCLNIGDAAFSVCTKLTRITIPTSVTHIGYNAFFNCTNLTIKCYKDSTAYNYAVANNIPYVLIKESAATPNAPTVLTTTYNSVTLTANSSYEYKMDDGEWQESNVFSGLAPNSTHTFYQRVKETETTYASESSLGLEVTTDKMKAATPSEPKVESKTHNSVTLKKVSGCEYSKDGENWQSSNVFNNLKPETEYTFYQRMAETDTSYASDKSDAIKVKTEPKENLVYENGVWYYTVESKKVNDTTLCFYNNKWFYVENGVVKDKTTLCFYNNKWYYVERGVVKDATTLCFYNNKWYYVERGVVKDATTLCFYNNKWYYVERGVVKDATTLCLYNGAWYYVEKGIVKSTTTLCLYNGTWFYVENGRINWKANTLCKYGNSWYYVKNGKVDWSATTLCLYNGIWFYVEKGVVKSKTTLCLYNGTWFYVENGRINWKSNTLCKYGNNWYYVKNGKVDWSANTRCYYNGRWYNVRNGVVR